MTDSPQPSPSVSIQSPPAPSPRRGRVGIWLSWLAIAGCLALTNWNAARPRASKYAQEGGTPGDDTQLRLAGQYALGVPKLMESLGAGAQANQMSRDLLAQTANTAKTPADRLRLAAVMGEAQGPAAALQQIRAVRAGFPPELSTPLVRDANHFQTIYTDGADSLAADARVDLLRRHDWFARLALSHGKPETDPQRAAVLGSARRTAIVMLSGTILGMGAGVVGLVLLIIAIVMLAHRRVRLAYSQSAVLQRPPPPPRGAFPTVLVPPLPAPSPVGPTGTGPPQSPPMPPAGMMYPPPGVRFGPPQEPRYPLQLAHLLESLPPGAGPYLEGFAIYIAGYIGVNELLSIFVQHPKVWMNFIGLGPVLLGAIWPRLRGVPWPALRRSLGWHCGRGIFREMICGLIGYVAGLPLLGIALLITVGISKLTGQPPAQHPIKDLVGRGLGLTLLLYALACVWAPITEETMFRGALFHHLRHRCHWLIAAPLVALIFAGIHPYGLSGIPVLSALAINFAAVREWRGSLIAPMSMHFLQNLFALSVMTLTLS